MKASFDGWLILSLTLATFAIWSAAIRNYRQNRFEELDAFMALLPFVWWAVIIARYYGWVI